MNNSRHFGRNIFRWLTAATLLVGSQTPLLAQTACTPERVSAAVDAFAREPYGFRAYRMMAGLGDPGIEAEGFQSNEWSRLEEWRTLVTRILPDRPQLQSPSYNCRISYPLETLKSRISKLTEAEPYVKQWLMAQEAVFAACSGDGAEVAMPAPATVKPELVTLQYDDRAYQEASIAFYRNPAKAVEAFRAIGKSSSVHRAAARYNIANLLANGKDVSNARAEIRSILADSSLASVHDITRQLEGYVANLEDSADGWSSLIDETVTTLSRPSTEIMTSEAGKRSFASALYDLSYAGVAPKKDDWWITNTLPANATLSKALADSARKHPLVLFALTGQTVQSRYDAAPWGLVGPKWQAWSVSYVDRALALQPDKLPSLPKAAIAALKTGPDETSRAALWTEALAAAEKARTSCGAAPETGSLPALLLNAVRVSAMAGDYSTLQSNLTRIGLDKSILMRELIWPKLARHMLAQGEAEQGRILLQSLPLGELAGNNAEWAEIAGLFAVDAKNWRDTTILGVPRISSPLFNVLSTKQLNDFAQDTAYTTDQRALFARATWTRNFALGKTEKLDDVAALNPAIAKTLADLEAQYPKLNREQLRLLTILRHPRFGVLVNSPDYSDPIESQRADFAELDQWDHNDKNWWCPLQLDRHLAAIRSHADQLSGLAAVNDYSADEIKPLLDEGALADLEARRDAMLKSHPVVMGTNWKELAALAKVSSAPRQLTLAATRWAKRTAKTDDAAAEALARAITVTRAGCNWNGGHKSYGKPAHELLRSKFADTSWAKETPYWFDCMHQVWDDKGNKVTSCQPKSWPKQKPLK